MDSTCLNNQFGWYLFGVNPFIPGEGDEERERAFRIWDQQFGTDIYIYIILYIYILYKRHTHTFSHPRTTWNRWNLASQLWLWQTPMPIREMLFGFIPFKFCINDLYDSWRKLTNIWKQDMRQMWTWILCRFLSNFIEVFVERRRQEPNSTPRREAIAILTPRPLWLGWLPQLHLDDGFV